MSPSLPSQELPEGTPLYAGTLVIVRGRMLQLDSMSAKTQSPMPYSRAGKPAYWLAGLAFWATASAAMAAAPKEVIVTREMQDIYRIGMERSGSGTTYIRTKNCNENVYGDRVSLKLNISIRGGNMIFRNGRVCTIDRFLREVDPNRLDVEDFPAGSDVLDVVPKGSKPQPPGR